MEQNNYQMNYEQRPPIQQPLPRQPVTTMPRRTKSKFLTFITALIPGAGQMYHGLLKKGLSIMILFWGIVALSVLLYIPVICFSLPVIWFYSFFDTVNRMNVSLDELAMIKDEYLYHIGPPHSQKFMGFFQKRHMWFGLGLTIIGVYAIFRMLLERSYMFLDAYVSDYVYAAVRSVVNIVPALLVPIVCIVIGVKLIKSGELIKHNKNYEQDDFKSE